MVNVGHGRQEVAEAIRRAAAGTSYVVPNWLTPEREALAEELLSHWLPPGLTRIHLCSGGSEANEAAIKLAVQYQAARGRPGKSLILARSLSYHGTTIVAAGVSGHASRKLGLEGLLDEPPTIETPYPLRCPLGAHHPEALGHYIENLKRTIAAVGADRIAALIAEPVNGSSGGAIAPPEGYWQEVAKVLKQHGILLILDEVMTGFGRLGAKFGAERYGIAPDILVAGKGLAGGYAAIAGAYSTEEIAQTLADSPYDVMFHTFSSLPLSCAAAAEVLQIIRREALIDRAQQMGERLLAQLQARLGQHPHVAEIRGQGLLIGIEVVKDRETLAAYPKEAGVTAKLVAEALKRGVFFYPGGTGEVRDILCIGAPFIIGEPEIERMADALEGALAAVTGA